MRSKELIMRMGEDDWRARGSRDTPGTPALHVLFPGDAYGEANSPAGLLGPVTQWVAWVQSYLSIIGQRGSIHHILSGVSSRASGSIIDTPSYNPLLNPLRGGWKKRRGF